MTNFILPTAEIQLLYVVALAADEANQIKLIKSKLNLHWRGYQFVNSLLSSVPLPPLLPHTDIITSINI